MLVIAGDIQQGMPGSVITSQFVEAGEFSLNGAPDSIVLSQLDPDSPMIKQAHSALINIWNRKL
jgi:hypothetical protein